MCILLEMYKTVYQLQDLYIEEKKLSEMVDLKKKNSQMYCMTWKRADFEYEFCRRCV